MAFRPYSPNDTFCPRVATPVLRPFCSFRYFLLVGCSIIRSCFLLAGLRHDGRDDDGRPSPSRGAPRRPRRLSASGSAATGCSLRPSISPLNTHLDPDDAVGRLGLGHTVIDVGAQGVQRHAAFAVPLGAGDLRTVRGGRHS